MFGYTLIKKKELKAMTDAAFKLNIKNRNLRDKLAIMERDAKQFDAQWEEREAAHAKELEFFQAKYADELQKRLELAELVKKMKAERHD